MTNPIDFSQFQWSRNLVGDSDHVKQGDKLVIVSSGSVSNYTRSVEEKRDQAVALLSFVELTILERKIVNGSYRPNDQHYGYRALGSDGWHYVCQWQHFDEASNNPYHVWTRDYVKDLHYKTGPDGTINEWIASHEEFKQSYLNWTVEAVFRGQFHPADRSNVLAVIKEKFPDAELATCDKTGRDVAGREYSHEEFGPFRKNYGGCIACQCLADQVKPKEEDHGTFVVTL